MAFMQECTTPADEIVTKTDLYKAYVGWGKVRKIKKIEAINRFGVLMKRGGYTDTRPRIEGERPTCYEGFVLDITKMEELLKLNKTQNGQGSMLNVTKTEEPLKMNSTQNGQSYVKNEEKSLTTTQTSINQIAEPHWFTLITKSGQSGQGYLPDKHIEIILLLGKERKIGIEIREDLREIRDHLGQSTEINHNMEATDIENSVDRDTFEKPTKTRDQTSKRV